MRSPFATAARRTFALILVAMGGVSLTAARPASAEPSAAERAIAETLYERGQLQMKDGQLTAACESFAESQRIDPGTGTLLNLAVCHETAGKLASAWAEFREAAAALRREPRPDRLRFATEHLARIERRLAYITVAVPDAARGPGVTVTLDGLELGRAAWGVAVPIDAGSHEARARYRDASAWHMAFAIRDGEHRLVAIPPTADGADGSNEGVPTDPGARERSARGSSSIATRSALDGPADRLSASRGSSRTLVGLGLGAAGLATLAIGAYLGLHAAALWSDRKHNCPMNVCTPEGLALGDRADATATAATWTIAGGAAAVVASGLVLFLPRERPRPSRLAFAPSVDSIAIDPAGQLSVGGRF